MHTVKRVCTLVLTGLLALPMAAPAGAAAASFSDLPSSHWAYIAMTEAAGYGILQGTGANTMSPSAPLTWPQFLAMAARAFAPEEYARSAASGAAWDQAGLDAARSAGLLEGLDEAALTGAVTRQDAAVVLCNALPEEYTPSFWDQPIDPTALSDWGRMDSLRQEAVAELARRCVIQGKADGSFGYADPLQRCDGAVLLMRVLEQVDNSCRGESQTVTLHILNADTGEALLPDQQVETEVSTYLSSLANGLDVGYYVYDYDRETASYTSTACDSYTLYFRPMTGAEIQEEQFWEKVERGEAAYEDYYKQDFWLSFQGDNARKHILLFGDESKSRFASQEEAAAAMTAVTVPVWQLSGGEKVSSTLTLSVHAALAEDAAQETLLRAWRRYGTFRGEAAERTWITAIALNVCRDLLRSPWHTRRMELSALAEPSAEDAPWDDTPLRAVLSLPRKYREVVLLRYYEEFTLEEIADTLGIAPGTVSARLTRAKRRLRPMLEEWYYD